MEAQSPSHRPPIVLSRRKKLAFTLVTFAGLALGLELAARVGSYLLYDRNPYYLFYGFRSWTDDQGQGHSDKRAGYFKFPAGKPIHHGTPEPRRINNHGFAGADFEADKPAGTFRVVCMGASSTFGYLNRDDETYPVQLEQRLRERFPGRRIEVLNAGIPHFNTDHILACLRRELFGFGPDLLTLYTGFNDATFPVAETRTQRATRWLDEYSAAFSGLRKAVNAAFGQLLHGRWAEYLPHMDRAAIERQLGFHLARTRANLEAILDEAGAAGVPLVLIRQPITLWFDRRDNGLIDPDSPRTTYEEEFAELSARLERQGYLAGFEIPLYVHHHLLDLMDELAAERGLAVVDNVALVSGCPEGLGSKVHLQAEANAHLADALAEALAPLLAATE